MTEPQDNPELEAPAHPPSPYEGTRLGPGRHLAVSSFWFGSNFLWGAMLSIVLPSQVGAILPSEKAKWVGVLGGIAALVALVVPLAAGALSDRCASRWGRRRPFIAIGVGINLGGLALMFAAASGKSIWVFLLAYCVVQLGNNIATAAYSGYIPDLVPEDQRGVASGYMAVMSLIGTLLGALSSGLLMSSGFPGWAYVAMGGALLLLALPSLFGIRETPLQRRPEPVHWLQYVKSLWIDPRKHPDFAWVWITRALVMYGFYSIQPFLLYYLADVIRVQDPERTAGSLLFFILLAAAISSFIGGHASDRIGRKKVVYAANCLIAAMCVALIFCRTLEQVVAVGVVFGLGYGAYISVDWALGTDVLPSRKSAAKDMAVWHISMVLPQSVAQPVSGMLLSAFGAREAVDPRTSQVVFHYTPQGYAAMFGLAAFFFALGALLLRNVKRVT